MTDSSAYEREFAHLVGASEAVAFGFARHALVAILQGAGLRRGDEVLLAPFTCKVVPLAILSGGFRPVYADVDAATFNLDPSRIAHSLGSNTRAVLFQHTYGHPGGLEAISDFAVQHGLLLVEDRAQTLPHAGVVSQHGAASIYSNNLLKPLPAGTGGIATLREPDLAGRVRAEAEHAPLRGPLGRALLSLEILAHDILFNPWLYWPLLDLKRLTSPAYRDRSVAAEIATEIERSRWGPGPAEVRRGLHSLRRVRAIARHSLALCAAYREALTDVPGLSLPLRDILRPLYYFPVLTRDSDAKERLVAAARHAHVELISWPAKAPIYPVLETAKLRRFGYEAGSCPVSEDLARRVICLPTHEKIDARQSQRIIELVTRQGGSRDARQQTSP